MRQFLPLYQFASDARRGTRAAWRHYHANTRVTTAAHCTSTSVHNETHQKPTTCAQIYKQSNKMRGWQVFATGGKPFFPWEKTVGKNSFCQKKNSFSN